MGAEGFAEAESISSHRYLSEGFACQVRASPGVFFLQSPESVWRSGSYDTCTDCIVDRP